MTNAATVDSAIEAIKAGALDYITKPFDIDRLRELLITVRKSIERRETLLRIDADVARQFEFYGLIGRSPVMQELFDSVRRFAPYARTVLVTGETGTGKELVAKALHRLGPRREKKLVTVNCSAVVETLFESELFGHMRGAFTGATDTKVGLFEHAHNGTIFLDEIGELPMSLQAKMLRAVELGEVQRVGSLEARRADVFAIAATNRDLRAEAAIGKFRSDLYFRLSMIELHIPPLRDRRDDIPYLTAAFVREFATKLNRPIKGITPAAERLLHQAPWPGNVRELRNVIERACILSDSRIVTERELASAMSVAITNVESGRAARNSRRRNERRPRADVHGAARSDHACAAAGERQQGRRGQAARNQPPIALPLARSPQHPAVTPVASRESQVASRKSRVASRKSWSIARFCTLWRKGV